MLVEIRRISFSWTPIEFASVSAFDFASADAFSIASLRAALSSFNEKRDLVQTHSSRFHRNLHRRPSNSSFGVSAEIVTCASYTLCCGCGRRWRLIPRNLSLLLRIQLIHRESTATSTLPCPPILSLSANPTRFIRAIPFRIASTADTPSVSTESASRNTRTIRGVRCCSCRAARHRPRRNRWYR